MNEDDMIDKKEDSWFGIYWRPAAAVIYLVICLFDFIVAPVYMQATAMPMHELVQTIKELPPESQNVIITMRLSQWEPLTLKGSGLFHVAFGAIIGASAWNRGRERITDIRQNMDPQNNRND